MTDLIDLAVALTVSVFVLILWAAVFLLTFGAWAVGLTQILKWAVGL